MDVPLIECVKQCFEQKMETDLILTKDDSKKEDDDDSNLGVCAACFNGLENEEFITALGQNYHISCFRCTVCDQEMWNTNFYFEKDGILFCKKDYWKQFGDYCQQCNEVVSGPLMICGEHRFHPECFFCNECHRIIGDGDSYALIERRMIFCGSCYRQQIPSSQTIQHVDPEKVSTSLTIIKKPPHFIRLVEIPWKRENKKSIKLSIDGDNESGVRISELEENPDLMTLHVGDKVIDINGYTVDSSKSLNEIQQLVDETDRVLHLTIEHDPNTITRKNPKSGELEFLMAQNISRNSSSSAIASSPSSDKILPPQIPPKKLDKARIAMKMDEGYMSGNPKKTNKLNRKNIRPHNASKFNCQQSSNSLREGKERSSSMSKLLLGQNSIDSNDRNGATQMYDLSRTKSFRVENPNCSSNQRIFRASDLIIGEMLGKGFFGEVYKVIHKETKEVMVLKELYRWVDEEAQKNFLKEVAVLRSLNHKNVLKFIGVLYKDKKLHLITEYVDGGTLGTLLQSNTPLSWPDRIYFARDISMGMAYLHSKSLIHRDLNSGNCLVRNFGRNKSIIVADFGLARLCKTSNDQNGTIVNKKSQRERKKRYTSVVGTPWYMAPEMLNGFKYDEKVDVFSFGIIICEIIGRSSPDPDVGIPRNDDFGLNRKEFFETFCKNEDEPCPEVFYNIAFLCTSINPDKRPSFNSLSSWFDRICIQISILGNFQNHLPCDILNEIVNFHGEESACSSTCNTPEEMSHHSEKQIFSLPQKAISVEDDETGKIDNLKIESSSNCSETILQHHSPHSAKDFNANGERNSWKTRRKHKIRERLKKENKA